MARPTKYVSGRGNAPVITSKQNKDADKDNSISVCTYCKRRIFRSQNYLWTSIGLVHKECDDEAKVAASALHD